MGLFIVNIHGDIEGDYDIIRQIPSADVRENIHGVWITNELNANYSPFDTSQEHLIRCSVCHNVANWKYDYCPNCGADMRGGE